MHSLPAIRECQLPNWRSPCTHLLGSARSTWQDLWDATPRFFSQFLWQGVVLNGFLLYVTENPTSQTGLKTKATISSLMGWLDASRTQFLSFSFSPSVSNHVRSPGYMEVILNESKRSEALEMIQGIKHGGPSSVSIHRVMEEDTQQAPPSGLPNACIITHAHTPVHMCTKSWVHIYLNTLYMHTFKKGRESPARL